MTHSQTTRIPSCGGRALALLVAALLWLAVAPPTARAQVAPPSFEGSLKVLQGDGLVPTVRFAGADRFETAGLIATESSGFEADFAGDTVILARADLEFDALAGSLLGGLERAPILLTPNVTTGDGGGLNPDLRATLDQFPALTNVIVLGQTAAVGEDVVAAIQAEYPSVQTERIGGAGRIETAALIADRVPATDDVIVARGDMSQDALVAGAIAAGAGVPILLAATDGPLDPQTVQRLTDLDPGRVLIAGGVAALSADVADQIEDITGPGSTQRVSGANRLGTAVAFAQLGTDDFGFGADHANLARADLPFDSLALGPHAGLDTGGPAPILLTAPDDLSAETAAYFQSIATCAFDSLHVAGSGDAVTDAVVAAARNALVGTAGEPCELALDPADATNLVGETHTVTATATDGSGDPADAGSVTFRVEAETGTTSGLSEVSGSAELSETGTATFDFASDAVGSFRITASVTDGDGNVATATASKQFVLPTGLVALDGGGPNDAPRLIGVDDDEINEITGVDAQLVGLDVRPSTQLPYVLGIDGTLATLAEPAVEGGPVLATEVGNINDLPRQTGTMPPMPIDDGEDFDLESGVGMDFNPSGPVALRIVLADGTNLRVAFGPDGEATTVNVDGELAYGDGDGNDGAEPEITAAGYRRSVPATAGQMGPGVTELYVLDSALNVLATQDPPNAGTLNTDGDLGVDLDDVNGFDLVVSPSGDDVAYAAIDDELHVIELEAGDARPVLELPEAGDFDGLAAGVFGDVELPDTLIGLADGNELVELGTDGEEVRRTAVTGVTGTLVGIDRRPSTGLLYGLADSGVLFTIDESGAATARGDLNALPRQRGADMSPITGGPDFSFEAGIGFDFNPSGPVALRIVTPDDTNLRIAFDAEGDAATVNVDGDIAYAADDDNAGADPAVSAAAYTNSLPATAGTMGTVELYVLDTALDVLATQVPANAGTLMTDGALRVDASEVNGFEVFASDGGDLPGADGSNAGFASVVVNGRASLYRVDLENGFASFVSFLDDELRGLSFGGFPVLGDTTFAVEQGGADLVELNAFGDEVGRTPITGVEGQLVGLDRRPSTGLLYGLSDTGDLYTIAEDGAATARGDLDELPRQSGADMTPITGGAAFALGAGVGFDFNPSGPVALRIVLPDGTNLRVALSGDDAATVNVDGDLAYAAGDDNAGAQPGVTAAAYTNSLPVTAGQMGGVELYVVDTDLDVLATQDPPNAGTLNTDGGLGVDASQVSAFDVLAAAPNDNAGIASLVVDGRAGLYGIDLDTGSATRRADLTAPLVGLAFGDFPALPGTSLGLADGNQLIDLDADGEELRRIPVPGVTGTLVVLDRRPSTGLLYGLTADGLLYSIDAMGAATLQGDLNELPRQSGADMTPLAGGTDFAFGSGVGFDFNPSGPVALRVVLPDGTNLRVAFAMGEDNATTVNVDGELAYAMGDVNAAAAPAVSAAGYTNSLPETAGTMGTVELYVLDAGLDVLATQDPPNAGTLNTDGDLGVDVSEVNGFDVVAVGGGDASGATGANVGIASLVVGGTAALYEVDLEAGTATVVGDLDEPLLGLAFDLG